MDITSIVGAVMLSGFIALNITACYLYVKKSISLDPESPMNHAISGRFDSVEDLKQYHEQHDRAMAGLADQRLRVYRSWFSKRRTRLDTGVQKTFPDPSASYADIK